MSSQEQDPKVVLERAIGMLRRCSSIMYDPPRTPTAIVTTANVLTTHSSPSLVQSTLSTARNMLTYSTIGSGNSRLG